MTACFSSGIRFLRTYKKTPSAVAICPTDDFNAGSV